MPCPCGSGEKYKHCCGALSNTAPRQLAETPDRPVMASTPSAHGASNSIAPVKGFETDCGSARRPFWSVVVPLYERRSYLKQCLDSILDQDPGPEEMEILVIDDASPSDLRDFVEGIGRGRVNYSRNANNLGLYASTNAALRTTRGRWLHILHTTTGSCQAFT